MTFRDRVTYEAQCVRLEDVHLYDFYSTVFGIYFNSILNDLLYFHITNGLALDIMHDVLEGIFQVVVKNMLKHYIIIQKKFKLSVLNRRLGMFKYAPGQKKNQPTHIDYKELRDPHKKLNQNASQMWSLARNMPLLIGDMIDENDAIWQNYLCLMTIAEYVFAPKTTRRTADYMGQLVEQFLTDFKMLYNIRLTPKMHYCVHLASFTKR